MKQTIFIFSGLSIVIFLLFQLSKYSLLFPGTTSLDFIVLFSGIVFILLGFFIHRILYAKPGKHMFKTALNTMLSKQEYKILCLMRDGHSNGEIADKLFIAESTVKKHVSNILGKLNARRRTEAIKIGRDMEII